MRKTLITLLVVLTAMIFVTGATAAPKQSAVGFTQTQQYANGDYATATITPTTTISKSVDGGTVVINSLLQPCGYAGYSYNVRYSNVYGVTLWTYKSVFVVYVCGGLVRYTYQHYDQPVDSCCGWGWVGNVSKTVSPLPYTVAIGYTEGHFNLCVPWYCDNKYPWVKMSIGYNGGLWAVSWGTG